ncbi:hypothetical protein PHYSODRAFT_288981 [Phytophthora sojae]|uniref:RxLR effector protein n=2 Tax=Phytophthora sojae TaxID=67593 RepID=G5ABL8_PHYSP|nr:hypothetical protein PHYSODRAFT_288981 [Phytophthora sojae]AEK81040.1 Avh253 [Phytophthora sojae]AEK81041.1 Avh253 [Phytophthora sojae]AEK81042.1 Avh253 [Phytophthora sojae]EGZ06743.1 hypothetical protein PHYSODRAFT_288981 [Phytophthora sojae]|eukprot:XP_009537507.1 hypothetical protein PHYSODRAFT_288981 [Phytophthora sojae]
MNKWFVQLVVKVFLLVSTDAFAAPPEGTVSKPSAPGVSGKRGLRSTDDAADEERADTTKFAQKLETALSKTKLGQKVQESKLAKIMKREALVKILVEKKASFKTLHSNKVTPGEFLKASGVNMAELPKANAAILVQSLKLTSASLKGKRYKELSVADTDAPSH